MTIMDVLFYVALAVFLGGIASLILTFSGVLDKWADAQRERVEALRWRLAVERGDRREMWRLTMRGRR